MAGWRSHLQPASFRGAPFHVLSTSTEVGRRNVLHQFPFQDIPYVEDLGKDAGLYSVTGYVVQNAGNEFDYWEERKKLMDALEASGPGQLVHPFYGSIKVSVLGKAKIDESFAEGGVARFQMTFVEYGAKEKPAEVVDQVGAVDTFADSLIASANEFFEKIYNPSGPSWLTTGAGADISKGLTSVQRGLYKIQSTSTSQLTSVLLSVSAMKTSVASIVSAPATIVSSVGNILSAFKGLIPYAVGLSGVEAFLSMLGLGDLLGPVVGTTPYGKQMGANRNAIATLFDASILAETMRQAVNVKYSSYDEAQSMMVKLLDAADNLLEYVGTEDYEFGGAVTYSDDIYDAIKSAKPMIVVAMTLLGVNLPVIKDYIVPPEVYPSLLMANSLYRDLDREQDIIDRNPVELIHPGFPSGGSTLEVLNV